MATWTHSGLQMGACWLALALCAVGCVEEPFVEDVEELEEELIGGEVSYERPEIGRYGGCTATLIRADVAITAAHCVGYRSRTRRGSYGNFTVYISAQQRRSYTVDFIQSYSRSLGENDVALLHLASPVPESQATPTRLADAAPEPGQAATIFGFGCTSRRSRRGQGVKRKLTYPYGRSSNLCPGDSGGPVVVGTEGAVFLINSGYYTGSGTDIFGTPWKYKERLEAQIVAWGGQPESELPDLDTPDQPNEIEDNPEDSPTISSVRVLNSSDLRVHVRCDGSEGPECSGWTIIKPGQSATVEAPDGRLILDNSRFNPPQDQQLRWIRIQAPGESVRLNTNPGQPLQLIDDDSLDALPPSPDADNCPDDRYEPNDERSVKIERGEHRATICGEDIDYLRVNIDGEWTVTLRHGADQANLDMWIYDAERTLIHRLTNDGGPEQVTLNGPAYLAIFSPEAGVAAYLLEID